VKRIGVYDIALGPDFEKKTLSSPREMASSRSFSSLSQQSQESRKRSNEMWSNKALPMPIVYEPKGKKILVISGSNQ